MIVLHHGAALAQRYWKWLPGRERHHFAVSDYLEESLRPALREFANDDEEVLASFDRFEFFQSLIYGDLNIEGSFGFWSPLGSFVWRRRELFDRVRQDIKQAGQGWKPLKAGLFSGSPERATEIVDKLEEFTNRVRGQLGIW